MIDTTTQLSQQSLNYLHILYNHLMIYEVENMLDPYGTLERYGPNYVNNTFHQLFINNCPRTVPYAPSGRLIVIRRGIQPYF